MPVLTPGWYTTNFTIVSRMGTPARHSVSTDTSVHPTVTHSTEIGRVLIGRDGNDSVPVVGWRAVVLGHEHGQEIFGPIVGGDVVEQIERGIPITFQHSLNGLFKDKQMLVR